MAFPNPSVPIATCNASKCMNFACPLNGVPESVRGLFFERNPPVARAWNP